MRQLPWLSSSLLVLAYAAFGGFLHHQGDGRLLWILALLYTFVQTSLYSIAWKPARNLLLLGFKSDVGYTIMALVAASLAVVILAWIQIFAYFLVMVAAALLLRMDLLARSLPNWLCFGWILLLSLLGLGLSWLPLLLGNGYPLG